MFENKTTDQEQIDYTLSLVEFTIWNKVNQNQ